LVSTDNEARTKYVYRCVYELIKGTHNNCVNSSGVWTHNMVVTWTLTILRILTATKNEEMMPVWWAGGDVDEYPRQS